MDRGGGVLSGTWDDTPARWDFEWTSGTPSGAGASPTTHACVGPSGPRGPVSPCRVRSDRLDPCFLSPRVRERGPEGGTGESREGVSWCGDRPLGERFGGKGRGDSLDLPLGQETSD